MRLKCTLTLLEYYYNKNVNMKSLFCSVFSVFLFRKSEIMNDIHEYGSGKSPKPKTKILTLTHSATF